ncbi:MAG: glutamate--tRNA ligase [Myxococcota bacterium]
MTVRTRIAPSPTGDPHVGTAYVALFNYCFAKKHGGQFVLRIEDTDQKRSTSASEQMIFDALRWVGLEWDEGPDVGGPHGPYRQSERSELYAKHTAELVEKGHAFHCFCSTERLAALRQEQRSSGSSVTGYDGLCMSLGKDEVAERLAKGESHVIRMVVPREGECVFQDVLRGEIRIPWTQVDMQVLMKSDGLPTYHLANVVDDHHMEITHVMRGEEWINSAPKHQLLYEYFGWDMPVLCHLPLLRNPDKSKLSKRKNPTSLWWYREMGYLPEGLLNYLGHMAWTMPDERDLFTLEEMVDAFKIEKIALGGPVFDVPKLSSLNARWLREQLDPEQFIDRLVDWRLNREFLSKLVPLVQQRVQRFTDLIDLTDYMLTHLVEVDAETLQSGREAEEVMRDLYFAVQRFTALDEWNKESIEGVIRALCEHSGLKMRVFVKPFYLAMSGKPSALPLFDSMEILGRDITRDRINHAIATLGGLGKKKLKKLDKELAALAVLAESE